MNRHEPELSAELSVRCIQDAVRQALAEDGDLAEMEFQGGMLECLRGTRLEFSRCRFENIRFSPCEIGQWFFTDCVFSHCDFSNFLLENACFSRVRLEDCRLLGATLEHCILRHALFLIVPCPIWRWGNASSKGWNFRIARCAVWR